VKPFSSLVAKVTVFTIVIGVLLVAAAIIGIDATARMYHAEANQRLHQELAKWLVSQYHFEKDGHIDITGITQVFGDAMRVNPSIEVYIVDTRGTILAFNAPRGHVKLTQVELAPILRFLSVAPVLPIFGSDPRNPQSPQTFSAAPIRAGATTIGYTYVVVGGELYQDVLGRLRVSRILRTAAAGAGTVVFAAALSGFAGFWFFSRRIILLASDMQMFSRSSFTKLPQALTSDQTRHAKDEIDRLRENFLELAGVVHRQVDQLKSADKQLREAITSLSHDLMTPLTALGGYLETIKMGADVLPLDEREKYVDLAVAQQRRVSRLVRSQFELATLESAAVPFDPQHASLSDLANDVGQKFVPAAISAGVHLSVESQGVGVYANADVGLLERVLENLISNAIRHTPAGGHVTLRVSEGADSITIGVEDTGSGIAAEDLPHVFDRYFRGSNVTRPRGEGAGLGLAIAKRIVELHGGEISVYSTLGSGTVFNIYLPRTRM
jgi:two-component system, OmpR family, sensor kinase